MHTHARTRERIFSHDVVVGKVEGHVARAGINHQPISVISIDVHLERACMRRQVCM